MATELGNFLGRQGHSIHVISNALPVRLDRLNGNINFHEVMVDAYPLFQYQPYELALASTIVEIVRKEKLEILHVQQLMCLQLSHLYLAHACH